MAEDRDRATIIAGRDRHGPVALQVPGGTVGVYSAMSPAKAGGNEDSVLVMPLGGDALLLAIADGVGGMPGGSSASRTALEAVAEAMGESEPTEEGHALAMLGAFDVANRAVRDLRTGSATTLTCALVENGVTRAAHAGDSMLLVTGQRGRIKAQAVAHSPTAYAVEAGVMTEQEAIVHDERTVVLNIVGAEDMRVDYGPRVALSRRDTLVLASDGLSDNLYVDEIVEIVRKGPMLDALSRLVEFAGERMEGRDPSVPGHADDLSVILYRPAMAG